jgi:hypothetical protein
MALMRRGREAGWDGPARGEAGMDRESVTAARGRTTKAWGFWIQRRRDPREDRAVLTGVTRVTYTQ